MYRGFQPENLNVLFLKKGSNRFSGLDTIKFMSNIYEIFNFKENPLNQGKGRLKIFLDSQFPVEVVETFFQDQEYSIDMPLDHLTAADKIFLAIRFGEGIREFEDRLDLAIAENIE